VTTSRFGPCRSWRLLRGLSFSPLDGYSRFLLSIVSSQSAWLRTTTTTGRRLIGYKGSYATDAPLNAFLNASPRYSQHLRPSEVCFCST
jgi:hypothetical protein